MALAGTILFRTNSGKGYVSGLGPKKGIRHLQDGSMVIVAPRPMGLGLVMVNGDTVPGLSDLSGYTKITITPEMVGRTVPIFTVIETKESGGGRKGAHQISFIDQVCKDGGIGGFASSAQQAVEIVEAWKRAPVQRGL